MTSKSKRPAMGRGLESLLPKTEKNSGNLLLIDIDAITLNPDQPRKYFNSAEMDKLSESIKEKGVLEPLIVRMSNGNYQLIAGQRRLIAAKTANLKVVPVVIMDVPDSSQERLELALAENLFRDDLNPIEEAQSILRLREEFQKNLDEIAKLMGKDRTTVSGTLRLLNLPDSIQDDIRFERISAGHGKVILAIKDKNKWEYARSIIISKKLSVRETESLAKKINRDTKKNDEDIREEPQADMAYYDSLEKSFTDALGGLNVKIKYKGTTKKIEIFYKDNKDIEQLMDKLGIVVS
jgi:ParB family chromosome partitioning protein